MGSQFEHDEKSKSFPNTRFKGEVLEEALNVFDVLCCHERDPKARASTTNGTYNGDRADIC